MQQSNHGLMMTDDMDGNIHLVLLLSGLCSLSSCVPQHQYVLVNTPKTWYEAQSYCREKCLDLATIDDMSEMKNALKAVENEDNEAVWIGLQSGENLELHWSLADKDFYKEGERNYLIMSDSRVTNCVIYKKGKLMSNYCSQKQFSVCFDGNKHGREQYVLIKQNRRWSSARDYCRIHHTDLTSVRNQEESQKIQEVAGDLAVWAGLFKDKFEWSDNTDSSFRYWREGPMLGSHNDETCTAMLKSKSHRWAGRLCDEPHPFLCNCPTVTFFKVRISAQDLDLNGPAVQEYILKQLKQKLSNNNVTNVSLRWKKKPDGTVFTKEPIPFPPQEPYCKYT